VIVIIGASVIGEVVLVIGASVEVGASVLVRSYAIVRVSDVDGEEVGACGAF